MYPNLSYFFQDLLGTDRDNWLSVFQTFGMFLALAFLVAAYFLQKELKRKEAENLIKANKERRTLGEGAKLGEVLFNGLFGGLVFFKLPGIIGDFESFKNDAAGYVFSKQGNIWWGLLGFALWAGYSYWTANKKKLKELKQVEVEVRPFQRVGDMTFIGAIFGLLGARLFSILENMDSFWNDPFGQIFSGSGLTIHGGLILAFIANYIYVKRNGIDPIHVMDAIAPALMISYGVGRMGCHFSGDGDWGIANALEKPSWFIFPDWAWAYSYPHNVLNEGVRLADCVGKYCMELQPPVFPTPIYEIIASFLIFGILWSLRRRFKWAGAIFYLYLILMSIERYLVEFIRVNPRYDFMGAQLSQAQLISIGLMLIGIGGFVIQYTKHKKADGN